MQMCTRAHTYTFSGPWQFSIPKPSFFFFVDWCFFSFIFLRNREGERERKYHPGTSWCWVENCMIISIDGVRWWCQIQSFSEASWMMKTTRTSHQRGGTDRLTYSDATDNNFSVVWSILFQTSRCSTIYLVLEPWLLHPLVRTDQLRLTGKN